jgi:epoxyqueuosine reductase
MDCHELTRLVKAEAIRAGFHAVGVARADSVADTARVRAWLDAGRHGTMDYMAEHFEKRVDPRELMPGARSVVSVAVNYYHACHAGPGEARPGDTQPEEMRPGEARPKETQPGGISRPAPRENAHEGRRGVRAGQARARGRISCYAWGDDYHDVVKRQLIALRGAVEARVPGVQARCCVDTAPVLEKYWAVASGLGWQGKHTNLITPGLGSWVFLGELILDRELEYDTPLPDRCGSCRRCLDVCPTNALSAPYQLDATRCIAYGTIEYRGEHLPPEIAGRLQGWVFGCDLCQEVCPWNRKLAQSSDVAAFAPRPENVDPALAELAALGEEGFRARFRKSPVKRTKWAGFLRNVRAAAAGGSVRSG